jgi:hypothetical protein
MDIFFWVNVGYIKWILEYLMVFLEEWRERGSVFSFLRVGGAAFIRGIL